MEKCYYFNKNKKSMKKIIISICLLMVTIFSFSAVPVFADGSAGCPAGTTCLENPLGNDNTSPQKLIGNVINAVMGIVGSIALLMFIFGGLTWMLSGGSSEKVKKGKDILVWSAVGLAVIFSSYALVYFVITKIK